MAFRPALTLNLLDPQLFPAKGRAPLSAWRSDQPHALDRIGQLSLDTKRQRDPDQRDISRRSPPTSSATPYIRAARGLIGIAVLRQKFRHGITSGQRMDFVY